MFDTENIYPVLILTWLLAPAFLAWRKGYPWNDWMFAGGPFGVAVLAFLLPANPKPTERRLKVANRIGGLLTAIQLVLVFVALFVFSRSD